MNPARALTKLRDQLPSFEDAEALLDEPLAPKTSIRVGGEAQFFVRPRSVDALLELLRVTVAEGVPVTLLGGGANTLVGDGGVPGITLKLPADFLPEEVRLSSSEGRVTLCAGASIARLIQLAKQNGLVGAEFLAGIPGTIGGAAAMNAGTKMGECMSVVEAVEIATAEGIGWTERSRLACRYRHTPLPAGGVITRVRFVLHPGDLAQSQAEMDADLGYRKRTQPLSQPNFGSVFQNPPGDFAGRLIEAAGLKGFTIGRAQISSLHANWIVNLGGATARDVVSLMELAGTRVREQTGIELRPEVKRVGVFT
jgi:UDP-N-acetylmuramate dehydrogenase